MKGRIRTILLPACLLAVLALTAGTASADDTGVMPESAPEVLSAAELPDAVSVPETLSAAELPDAVSVPETSSAAQTPEVQGGQEDISPEDPAGQGLVNLELAAEYYEKIREMVYSDTFQSLIKYPEVQELALELVRLGAGFMVSDRDLSEKIMLELGVDEKTAAFILFMMKNVIEEIESDKYVDSETEQAFMAAVEEYVDSGELTGLLAELGVLRTGNDEE